MPFFVKQNLIKSAIDKKSEEKRQKEDHVIKLRKQHLLQWSPFGKLSENLQNIIKEYQQYNGQQTERVDVDNLFSNLPKDVEINIKRELCLEMLKTVSSWSSIRPHSEFAFLTYLSAYRNQVIHTQAWNGWSR